MTPWIANGFWKLVLCEGGSTGEHWILLRKGHQCGALIFLWLFAKKKGFCCLCRLNASMWHDCKMKSVFSLNGADLNLQSNNLAWIQKEHAYTHSFITDINRYKLYHYIDVIMSSMASQFTCVSIVYLTVCSGADQRKQNQNSASLAFVLGIRRWLLNLLHKGPLTQKMFPFDDVIM